MTDTSMTTRTPWHLWVVGVLALCWNGYAGYDFIMTLNGGAEYLADYFNPEQVAYYTSMPSWTIGPWAAGVWGGVLGSILLLLRSRWAFHAFVLSVLGVAVSIVYAYMNGWAELGGTQGMMIWAMIAVVALFLVWYARMMTARGVLR